jgi:hypothetical protein
MVWLAGLRFWDLRCVAFVEHLEVLRLFMSNDIENYITALPQKSTCYRVVQVTVYYDSSI